MVCGKLGDVVRVNKAMLTVNWAVGLDVLEREMPVQKVGGLTKQ